MRPLALSMSKGASGAGTAIGYPLKWFDKLTMSGKGAWRPEGEG